MNIARVIGQGPPIHLIFWLAGYPRMHRGRGGAPSEHSSALCARSLDLIFEGGVREMVIGQFNEALPGPPMKIQAVLALPSHSSLGALGIPQHRSSQSIMLESCTSWCCCPMAGGVDLTAC